MNYLTHKNTFGGVYKNCFFTMGHYLDGKRPSLTLWSTEEGPLAQVTVNIPEVKMPEDCVAIKDYSENEGMLKWLIENNLIKEVVKIISHNWVKIPIVKLNMKEISKYLKED